MTDPDLSAIRARDADYNDVFEAQASMSKDIAHRLVAWPVADRRALLAYVDALAAEFLTLKEHCAALESREVCTVAHDNVETCGYCQRDALSKDAERYRDDAREYHRVMGWLRATKMQHGLCQPRERRACTHCNAVDNLEDAITAYRGPPIILAATMEQSP